MRTIPTLALLFSFLTAQALTGCADPAGAPPAGNLVGEVDADSAAVVAVDDDRGNVEIRVEDERDSVAVYAELAGGEASDRDDVDIEVRRNGNSVEVEAIVPSDEVSADLDIRVPSTVALEVQTLGDVLVYGHSGDATIQSEGGNVELEVDSDADTEVTIETQDGDVLVTLPAGAGAQITASASGGEVRFEGLTFDGVNVGGAASGTLGDGSATFTVETSSGDITFRAM